MDKPRTGHAEKRRMRRYILAVIGLIVVVSITVGISRLEPAAPEVDKETLFTGLVERGPMKREVRGPGSLVPVDIRIISLPVEGRVERIPALPGVMVTADTVILEMTNPELQQNLFEAESQLHANEADLDELRRRQVEYLKGRAGIPGVLQELPVQVGQRVTPGTTLARVARPEKLKAELRIPEVQAKDVTIGLPATIDTRNGLVPGRVLRVAPSVQEGSVTVDVALEGPLPKGARPDLTVDGMILLENLPDVIHIPRPSFGAQGQKVEMFRLVDGGKAAVRVPVEFGRSSVSTMEVVSGLKPGDQVILSDTSQFDGHDRIRLK